MILLKLYSIMFISYELYIRLKSNPNHEDGLYPIVCLVLYLPLIITVLF